jgi:quaternary ammonium compound-resistance protein SugE
MISLTNPNIAWTLLAIAGLLEVVWATSMKASDGFSKGWATGITFFAAWLSFWLLGLAVKVLPVGTAYAVWTGIGAVGAACLGVLMFHEPIDAVRIVSIGLVVIGIIGLKVSSS